MIPQANEMGIEKLSQSREAKFAATHGRTEEQKRQTNKEIGPKKYIISIKKREQQVLDSVPINHRKNLELLIKEYRDIFPGKLPKGGLPKGKCNIQLTLALAVNLPIDHHIDWVLLSRVS